MGKKYRYATCLTWGGDEPTAEIEVEVEYEVAWGSPETGRFGRPEDYDPGCASTVESIKLLTVEGRPRPWGMGYGFMRDDEFEADVIFKLDDHEAEMIDAAVQDDESARDSYLEQQRKDDR